MWVDISMSLSSFSFFMLDFDSKKIFLSRYAANVLVYPHGEWYVSHSRPSLTSGRPDFCTIGSATSCLNQ